MIYSIRLREGREAAKGQGLAASASISAEEKKRRSARGDDRRRVALGALNYPCKYLHNTITIGWRFFAVAGLTVC
jgi:hypothetical protein